VRRHLLVALLLALSAFASCRVQAETPASTPEEALLKLRARFKGAWSFQQKPASFNGTEFIGRRVSISIPKIINELPQIIEATKSAHHLAWDVDFLHEPEIRSLGRIKQIVLHQQRDGHVIENAEFVISVNDLADSLRIAPHTVKLQALPQPTRSAEEARAIAIDAFCKALDAAKSSPDKKGGTQQQCSATVSYTQEESKPRWLTVNGTVHVVYHFTVDITDAPKVGPEACVVREYDISGTTSEEDPVIRVINRCHLAILGTGRAFDPNPMTIRKRKHLKAADIADDDISYKDVDLPFLNPPKEGIFTLDGTYVLFEQGDSLAPPTRAIETESGIPTFRYSRRDDPAFSTVMAYYHLTTLQTHAGAIGFGSLRNVPLAVHVLNADMVVNNASVRVAEYREGPVGKPECGFVTLGRFSPPLTPTIGDAEDAEIIAHEYGHSLLCHDANGYFSIAPEGSYQDSQADAISEGFADFWGIISYSAETKRERHSLFCFADWGGYRDCLRRIPKKRRRTKYVPALGAHRNGMIWSSALIDIFETVFKGDRSNAEIVILQGHLNAIHPGSVPTMSGVAAGILLADQDEFNGEHRDALCDAFRRHAISPSQGCKINRRDLGTQHGD
jgi:hypothetical protein